MEVTEGSEYFQSYEDLEIHKLMLEDSVRNQAYKKAIFDNAEAIKGKIVMDVGAGTGILSIFCAQVGAARVYAVEASDTYKLAEEIVKENGFENVIQVIHSRVEDLNLHGDTKVDVIVSEWMGFYLFHEGMLDSVIAARDKFLKHDGLMFPDTATLYAAPCSVPNMFDKWKNLDGISMKSFAKHLRNKASQKPETSTVKPEDILAIPESIFWFDLKEITLSELNTVKLQSIYVCSKPGLYQGLSIWFTCTFPSQNTEPVILSTDPDDTPTHWRQTTVVFPEEIAVDKGEPIAIDLLLKRSEENARRYNIEVTMLDAETVEHPEYCNCHMTKCILSKAVLDRYGNNDFGAS